MRFKFFSEQVDVICGECPACDRVMRVKREFVKVSKAGYEFTAPVTCKCGAVYAGIEANIHVAASPTRPRAEEVSTAFMLGILLVVVVVIVVAIKSCEESAETDQAAMPDLVESHSSSEVSDSAVIPVDSYEETKRALQAASDDMLLSALSACRSRIADKVRGRSMGGVAILDQNTASAHHFTVLKLRGGSAALEPDEFRIKYAKENGYLNSSYAVFYAFETFTTVNRIVEIYGCDFSRDLRVVGVLREDGLLVE